MRYPHGISDFRTLIREGYHYVDKTRFIAMLEEEHNPYQFFLRPRRFGKSLWLSTLSYYYDRASRDEFDRLFGHLVIGSEPTSKASGFSVLRLDFSRIETETAETARAGFIANVLDGIERFEMKYGDRHTYSGEAAMMFDAFLRNHVDKQIILLIDEYDHFANEVLSRRVADFSDMVAGTGFVRKFYEAVKVGTGNGTIVRIFATGVMPITLDSLTSGFNIAVDLTNLARYNELMGFSEDELGPMVDAAASGEGRGLLTDMRDWYDGYLFHVDGRHRVYNPSMSLYFLAEVSRSGSYPEKWVDTNIASDYGKIKGVCTIGDRETNYAVLNNLIRDRVVTAGLTAQFSFARRFTEKDFISLLFYMGFVTIHGDSLDRLRFTIPNAVIESLYLSFFVELLETDKLFEGGDRDIEEAIRALAMDGDPKPFLVLVEGVLEKLSNRDMCGFDEKYIKVLFVAFAARSQVYFVRSEVEVDKRYPDIMFLARPPIQPRYEFVFEIKYLKKAQADALTPTANAAEGQLCQYLESDLLRARPKLRAYTVVFVGARAADVRLVSVG